MKILAIDTAAELCAACLWDAANSREVSRAVLDIGKGHAEHVMAVIAEALEKADATYADIGGIAVSVGPGSFTGVRVGVAAARGLALALECPSIGVSTLEALAAETRERHSGRSVLVAVGTRPESLYAACYDGDGAEILAPAVFPAELLAGRALADMPVLCGSAADTVAAAAELERPEFGSLGATADIAVYARLAARRGIEAGSPKPKPLYLREPDAKPRSGFALPLKTG